MKTRFLALSALVLAAAVPAAASAQQQLRVQSQPVNFQLAVSKWVEIVDKSDGTYDIDAPFRLAQGGTPPGYTIFTDQGHPISREVRSNTAYRLSLVGLDATNGVVFTDASGHELKLAVTCDLLASNDPTTRNINTIFPCVGSNPFPSTGAGSRWVFLWFTTGSSAATNQALAGTYTATVYLQADAV